MPSSSIKYLRDYVAIPSVNPMRRTDMPPEIVGERRYAEHLREQLRGLALDAELIGDPERPSLVAEARVPGASDTVLIASHLDTVPVDGMAIDPFDPVIADGRLYGRGSCDTKGGMAALVDALERTLARGTLRRNVIVVGEADEELGSDGAHAVVRHLRDRPPDWAIATEPTDLRIVTAHKGVVHAHIVAHGIAGHSSEPTRGRNAISALARAIVAVDRLSDAFRDRPDPRLGPATLSIGLVEGGSAPNIIPERATFTVDRRVLPGEDDRTVTLELERALDGLEHVEIAWCRTEKLPLETADDAPCVRAAQRALATLGRPQETDTVAFATDAGILAEAGVPSLVLGPGSITLAHTAREYVPTAEVEAMAELLVALFESPG